MRIINKVKHGGGANNPTFHHTNNHHTIAFVKEDIGHIITMDDFYKAVGLTDTIHSDDIKDVQQIWMNASVCDEMRQLCKRNARKSKKYKHLSDYHLETSVTMDWLCYSPVSVTYIPENEIWIWSTGNYKQAMEEYRLWYRESTRKELSMNIKVKYFTDIDPIQEIPGGDWYDLRAAEDVAMNAGEFKLIPLGVAMKLPHGYEAHVAPRSSTYKKYRITEVNSIGIIDNSYCGDNDQWYFPAKADEITFIPKNTRICQFRLVPKQTPVTFETVEYLDSPDRGGFGSTGTM